LSLFVKKDYKKFEELTWVKTFKKGEIKTYAAGENVKAHLKFDFNEKTVFSYSK